MCDITNNFLSKLSIRGGSGHLFLFCKIVVVLLIYQLFLRLCQKPWKNWEPTIKQDGSQLSSNYLLLAAPVLDEFLSKFFTVIIRHGYMPQFSGTAHWFLFVSQGRIRLNQTIIDPLLWPLIWVRFLNDAYYYSLAPTNQCLICSLALKVVLPLILVRVC